MRAVALVAGGAAFVVMDRVMRIPSRASATATARGPRLVFFAVAVDLFRDGLLIGSAR